MADIIKLLSLGVNNKASDLHLSSEMPPLLRINGDIKKINIENKPLLDREVVKNMIYSIMKETQIAHFEKHLECDFSFNVEGVARFRVNVFMQDRGIAAVFRTIPSKVLTLKELGAPSIFSQLMHKDRGLILVTGPTGSGKSTTLAAMVDYYNKNFNGHILTIEDPIEFVHKSDKSIINQREVGSSTHSFSNALRSALREDPDVILVGELRDLETIRLALTAAETGHLVLGTLHSSSASKTINRIIDVFPEGEKTMVRTMIAESLEAIISQCLVKNKSNTGRLAAHEILVGTHAIRNLIRENKIPQIYSSIETGQKSGMQTMKASLKSLVNNGLISPDVLKGFERNSE